MRIAPAEPLPQAILWQQARITRILRQTERVTSFFFVPMHPFAFRAGQHVDVRLTAPDGYSTKRSYSVASGPETAGEIELAIERLEGGEVSPYFHEVAAVGDVIELRGPLGGHFVWSVGDGGPILLVGGGSGVAPLMSMIRHRAAEGATVPMTLVFSARTWDGLLFREELIALHDRHDGFDLVVTTTRDTARRAGDYTRRIDAPMMADVLARLGIPKTVFVCGSNPFVSTGADGLIAAGLEPERIRTERYGV